MTMEAEPHNQAYTDLILPNKKYYYLFRTSTFHDTPSNMSQIHEVEIVKTAADVYLNAKLIMLEEEKEQTTKMIPFKRLLKVSPNFQQISYPDQASSVEQAIENIGILNKKLFNITGNKFKIRITSKHTGKKIDLNLKFKIIKKTN